MIDPFSLTSVLSLVTNRFIDALITSASDRATGGAIDAILAKLRGDPVKKAFQQALGLTIQRYSEAGGKVELAAALLRKDGPLAAPEVVGELAHVVRFDRPPDLRVVADHWRQSVAQPARTAYDFEHEAGRLLTYLEAELRGTEAFRPVFDAKSLDAIAATAAVSAATLAEIEGHLANLNSLFASQFGDSARMFTGAAMDVRARIRDYTSLLAEKTRGFVGRQFVFEALEAFLAGEDSGYFFIRGDPGIGKTTLAAQLVRSRGYVHHFNVRAEGIGSPAAFLENVCAQLIAVYGLDHVGLPPDAGRDAGFLNQLLGEVSAQLSGGERAVIVVDALDEANVSDGEGANVLFLPVLLPPRVHFVATMRNVPLPLRVESAQRTLELEHESAGNRADIRQYITESARQPGIQAYIASHDRSDAEVIDTLAIKSEGNFMYLRYVMAEIERGAYQERTLESLPVGLRNYYEDHWRRMRGRDEEAWFTYKLPVVMALTAVKEPVSIAYIGEFSGVREPSRIRAVLREWQQFLHVVTVEPDGRAEKCYSVYHASFHDFIAEQEDVQSEHVSRRAANARIGAALWDEVTRGTGGG